MSEIKIDPKVEIPQCEENKLQTIITLRERFTKFQQFA